MLRTFKKKVLGVAGLLGILSSTSFFFAGAILEPEDYPSAGELGAPLVGVDVAQYNSGRVFFDKDFQNRDGLGPHFNADSCQACHNRGAIGGAGRRDLNVFRVLREDDDGILSHASEGPLVSRGSRWDVAKEDSPRTNRVFEERNSPPLFGLGLLEKIPRTEIESRVDEDDSDGDGISGRIHELENGELGRFGWKAQIPTIRDFVHDAFGQELSVTTVGSTFAVSEDDDEFADPELDPSILDDVEYFIQSLAPPPLVSNLSDGEEFLNEEGEDLFESVGCTACHVPELSYVDADTSTPIIVRAFTDLLLHDLPDALAAAPTGIPDGDASATEFRTPPLWGLRFSAPYFHDGYSESVENAILRHGGEGASSVENFQSLSEGERAALLFYVENL